MPALRDLLTELGYEDVRTYLQSGNVVLTSPLAPDELAPALEEQIEAAVGVDVAVVVRTREELEAVVRANPFPEGTATPKLLQVTFLSAAPDPDRLEGVTDADFGPERCALVGRELFAWHPDGVHGSKLARLLTDKRLGVTCTGRNWNTVLALLELMDEPAAGSAS